MTPEGVILTRPGMAARRGEERYVAQALAKIGVPILRTIAGDGMFEGANAMWVDRHTCVVSTGVRCNRSGFEQVKYELERMGVYVYHMQQPYSNIHIDGLMNPISHDKVLIHASQVPYDIIDMLKKKGYEILEAPSQTEVRECFACNFVALEPNHIVIAKGPAAILFYAMIRNVTVEKKELENYKSQEKKFRHAVEHAKVYFWEYTIATKEMRPCFRCMRDLGLPAVVQNYPEPLIESGIFPADYADMYRDMMKKIDGGAPELEAYIPLTSARIPFIIRYTTEFDSVGNPIKAFGSATMVNGEKSEQKSD